MFVILRYICSSVILELKLHYNLVTAFVPSETAYACLANSPGLKVMLAFFLFLSQFLKYVIDDTQMANVRRKQK